MVEAILGVSSLDSGSPGGLLNGVLSSTLNATASLLGAKVYEGAVGQALADAAPMLTQIALENGIEGLLSGDSVILPSRTPLVTT